MEQPVLVGIFEPPDQGDRALAALLEAGFRLDQLKLMTRPEARSHPGTGVGAATGALTGGPEALSAGAGIFLADLFGLGIPEPEVHTYDQEYQAGRAILVVRTEGRTQEAQEIFRRYGARGPRSGSQAAPGPGS